MERHDVQEANYPYRKAVIEGLLDMDRCDCVPAWLSKFFEVGTEILEWLPQIAHAPYLITGQPT